MWLFKICPTSRERGVRSTGLRAVLLAVLLIPALSPTAARASTMRVRAVPLGEASALVLADSRVAHVFSESITFSASVRADAPPDATLFFGRVGVPLVRRVYVSLAAQEGVYRAEHQERVEPGQYAPGTEFRSWWEFASADGSRLRTPEVLWTYTDDRFEWQLLAGENVDFSFYGRQADRARALLASSEDGLHRLQEDIGVPVEGRVRVYAYESARDMERALSRRSEGYDDRVLTLGVVVDERTLLLLASHRDAHFVVAHELSHIVVGNATRNPFVSLPRWLDEGLAMQAEGELPASNLRVVEQAVRTDSLISLRSMTSYSGQADQVDLYYGQAHSIVGFMVETYGRDKMRELLGVFSEGTLQDDALQAVYGLTLQDLEDAWRADLGLSPRPRGQG